MKIKKEGENVDYEKTGKFIAGRRKELDMTQKQLAEKLMISDKAVSKWECGKGMPGNEILVDLCKVLQINVNELLAGESISEESYQRKAEENMLVLMKNNDDKKKRSFVENIVGIVVLIILLLGGLGTVMSGNGMLMMLIDAPSLLLIVSFMLFMLFVSEELGDFFMAFSIIFSKNKEISMQELKLALHAVNTAMISVITAGVFGSIAPILMLLGSMSNSEKFGANIAVSLLMLFYAIVIVMFLIPVRSILKKRTMS